MCLQSLSHPPLPSSALCHCPALTRTLERSYCVNWVSEPFVTKQHCNSTPTHTVRRAQTFLSNIGTVYLSNRCLSLKPTPSCRADCLDATDLVGSFTIWFIWFYVFKAVQLTLFQSMAYGHLKTILWKLLLFTVKQMERWEKQDLMQLQIQAGILTTNDFSVFASVSR